MIKVASQALTAINNFVEENPALSMGILGGGLGAVGGAALTGEDPEESPEERTKRRIKNALILGGLGAGSGALMASSVDQLSHAVPEKITTPEEDVSGAIGYFVNPITGALGAGAGSAYGLSKLRDWQQADLGPKLKQLIVDGKKLGVAPISDKATMSELRATLPEVIAKLKAGGSGVSPEFLNALQSQFGAKELKDLPAALQHYGISTRTLEEVPEIANALEGSPASRNALKFLRRNWRVGLPAAAIAGLTGITSAAMSD